MEKITTPTNYTGSQKTAQMVATQIMERYGKNEVKKYEPKENCRTFKQWLDIGYRVRKGEKAIKSYIVLRFENKKGELTSRLKTINLFYIKQVDLIK